LPAAQNVFAVVETGQYRRAAKMLHICRSTVFKWISRSGEDRARPLPVYVGMALIHPGERLAEGIRERRLRDAGTLERIRRGAGSRPRDGIAVQWTVSER